METSLRQLAVADHRLYDGFCPRIYTAGDVIQQGDKPFLPVRLLDRTFLFPGFKQDGITKFVPFFRDDPFLSMCAAAELSSAIIHSRKKPSIMVYPPSSKSEKMIKLTNAFLEQILLTITQQNIDIPLLKLAIRGEDELAQTVSESKEPYRIRDGVPYYLDIPPKDQQVIIDTLIEGGNVIVVDDVRRTGHTERCILQLLGNIIGENPLSLLGKQLQCAYVAVVNGSKEAVLPNFITTVMAIP